MFRERRSPLGTADGRKTPDAEKDEKCRRETDIQQKFLPDEGCQEEMMDQD